MLRAPVIKIQIRTLMFIIFTLAALPFLLPAAQSEQVILSREELAFIKNHPRIVLGMDNRWGSTVRLDDGTLQGYETDILNLVNQHTGANFVLQAGVWRDLVEKAKNGQIDGLASSFAQSSRKQYFEFSDRYLSFVPMAIVIKENPCNIRKWEDLNGKRIAIQKGVRFQEEAIKTLTPKTIVRVERMADTIFAVISGKADAGFGFGAFGYMREAGKLGISKMQFAFSMEKMDVVFSIRRDWPLATRIMNKGLRAIPDKEYDRIFDRWYGALGKNRFELVRFLKIALPLALAVAIFLALYFRKMNQRLLLVQNRLKEDIAKRKQAQEKLDWKSRVNKILAQLADSLISTDQDITEIASKVLSGAKRLTLSECGYVSEIDRKTFNNIIHTQTDMFSRSNGEQTDGEQTIDQPVVFPRGEDGQYPGVWGHALNTKAPFYSNLGSGYPVPQDMSNGVIHLTRVLSMPVKYGDQIIGQIALANAPINYGKKEVDAVQQLADLYALAIHRKHSQEESQFIEKQLYHAQKMESLGTLAGGIAHDFNNLLTIMIGYSEMVIEDIHNGTPEVQSVKEIHKAGLRAKGLVTQILAFSRKMDPVLVPVDLNQTIREAEKMLARAIPKMIVITYYLAENIPRVNADTGNITQVLMNLFANAHDAMPDGGRITVETTTVSFSSEYAARYTGVTPGEYVCLSVADTGTGMDPETIEHIFDPFFTRKEIGKGTGLGLSTVYGIIKSHGGHIICNSEPNRGTIFKLYLPALKSENRTPDRSGQHPDSTLRGSGQTILLVDDESQVRKIGHLFLTRAGYQVIQASSGEEALAIYRECGSQIALVILDINMPGMGGQKCMNELVLTNPEVKIIISSGYASNDRLASRQSPGMCGYVPKPYTMNELLGSVRDTLNRQEKAQNDV